MTIFKHLLEVLDILHATVDGGTKQSFEKTKKKAHKAVHYKGKLNCCTKVYCLLNT